MSRQYFSQVVVFGSMAPVMACDISKASVGEGITVPSRAPRWDSDFPNTCVMTRKASDPLYLKEGCRCALKICRRRTNCHCLQLTTGYMFDLQIGLLTQKTPKPGPMTENQLSSKGENTAGTKRKSIMSGTADYTLPRMKCQKGENYVTVAVKCIIY